MPDNYQPKLRCPKCGKRKVYVRVEDTSKYVYYCTACGYEWGG